MEQRAVRQVGQGVVMRQMRDALFGAVALGDVLVRGHPSAVWQRLVDDLDGAAVRGFDRVVLPQRDVAQNRGAEVIDVLDERAGRLALGDEIAKEQPGFTTSADRPYISMIALVADDQPLR